jgi:hypothetical protein
MTASFPTTRPSRRRLALGLGALAVILVSGLLLVPRFGYWLREEWHVRRLGSGDIETKVDAASKLLEMRSVRGWVRILREPQPVLERLLFGSGNDGEPAAGLMDLDPDTLERYMNRALTRGELTEADLVRFLNLLIPSWRQMMQDLGMPNPPQDLRSIEDLPQFFDAIRRFVELSKSIR